MSTARKIIERAFSKIGVKAAESPLSPSEIEDGLDSLNDLLNTWNSTGELKGVSPVQDVGTDLQEPDYATMALKSSLAIILAGEYGVAIPQGLPTEATIAMSSMIVASANTSNVEFPPTLPRGSGNQNAVLGSTFTDFFPEKNRRNF